MEEYGTVIRNTVNIQHSFIVIPEHIHTGQRGSVVGHYIVAIWAAGIVEGIYNRDHSNSLKSRANGCMGAHIKNTIH